MERIDYFRIFGFLVFTGSAFWSAIFNYPAFMVLWFVIMLLFMVALYDESSELTILAFAALACIPLGLISVFSNYLDKTPPSNFSVMSSFAWFLTVFLVIEFILAVVWIEKKRAW